MITDLQHQKRWKAVCIAALTVLGVLVVPATADASVLRVTSGADSGPGTFRAAVDAASNSASVRRISFAPGVVVDLATPVVFEGSQRLVIDGNGATVSGASVDAAAHTTWDSGLLVVNATDGLVIRDLAFRDSFNNGLAVFAPADGNGSLRVVLDGVAVTGSKFHGVFVDAQSSSGYNTDGDLHDACVDPFPVDSGRDVVFDARAVTVSGNGTLRDGYDDSLATGCPRDFDGVRVDQGGDGSLVGRLSAGTFDGNLADGVEFDETGGGDVDARVWFSTFDANGESGETVDALSDLDDGFDIDEAGAGDVRLAVWFSSADSNRDEGFDMDEAGPGSVIARVLGVRADGNEDEGIKIGEEDAGSLSFDGRLVESSGSLSQDGIELEETGDGDLDASLALSEVRGNDGDGVKVTQEDAGSGRLVVRLSDLSGNADDPIAPDGVDVWSWRVVV